MPHHTISLILNSSNRTSGTNENFSTTMTPPIKYIHQVILTGYNIPVSFYNITANNNTFIFDNGGGDLSATVAPDNYTGESLAAELEIQMNLAAAGHTVTFDNITFKFTFSFAGATFNIPSITTKPLSTLFPRLGFSVAQTGATTYTSDQVADLNTPKHINIKSTIIAGKKLNPNLSDGAEDEFIYVIFPKVNFGCAEIRQNESLQEYEYIRDFQADSIDLRLEDGDGNILDLNGVPWCISFDFIVA